MPLELDLGVFGFRTVDRAVAVAVEPAEFLETSQEFRLRDAAVVVGVHPVKPVGGPHRSADGPDRLDGPFLIGGGRKQIECNETIGGTGEFRAPFVRIWLFRRRDSGMQVKVERIDCEDAPAVGRQRPQDGVAGVAHHQGIQVRFR